MPDIQPDNPDPDDPGKQGPDDSNGKQKISICITEISVRHVWRGVATETGRVAGRSRQWGGVISTRLEGNTGEGGEERWGGGQ